MTQESASQSMVSMLQGFNIEAKDAERVLDSVNEVANNFAIDTAGIGEALQRSAAAFSAAGTDLNKSIALVTTSNAVVQDPASVGTMFKTLSARIRGSSIELQELGEEEDEFTKSTSKLRDLVKGVTGFDIMKDKDTYKDIYDILVGIGDKWNDLTDIQRAGLLEALGGKRAVNGLSAVLNNIKMLKDAYNTAEQAEGSAAREQENYAQSVEFSLNRAKASLQELAADFLSSDFLKGAIDAGNKFIEVIDNIVNAFGPLIPLLGVAGTGNYFLGKMNPQSGSLMTGLIKSFTARGNDILNGTTFKDTYSQFINAVGSSTDFDKDIIGNLSNFKGINDAAKALNKLGVDGAKSVDYITQAFEGTSVSAARAAVSTAQMGTAMSGLSRVGSTITGMLTSPAFWGVAGIAAAIAAVNAYKQHIEEIRQGKIEGTNEWESSKKSLDEYRSKITELKTQLDSQNLSAEQQVGIKQQLLSIQQEIVSEYGKESQGINLVTGDLQRQLDVLDAIRAKEAARNLSEHHESYESARKAMTAHVSRTIATDRSIGYQTEIDEFAKNATDSIPGLKAYVNTDSRGFRAFGINIDTENVSDAVEALDAFEDKLTEAENKAAGSDNQNLVDSFKEIRKALEEQDDSIRESFEENKAVYDAYLEQVFVKAGGAKYVRDLEQAVSNYNSAVAEMDPSKLQNAREEVEKATGDLQNFYNDKGSERGIQSWQIDDYIDSATESLDEYGAKYTDFKEVLSGKSSEKNQYSAVTDAIKQRADAIKELGVDTVDVEDTLQKYKDGFFENAQLSESQSLIVGLANSFGLFMPGVETSSSIISGFIDVLTQEGLVIKSVSDDNEDAANGTVSNLEEISTAANDALSRIDAVNAAIVSSMSSKGMSFQWDSENGKFTGDVQNLMDAFSGADYKGLYNPATLFQRTANGIKVNVKELKKLEAQQEKITKQKFYQEQKRLTEELAKAEAARATAAAKGQSYDNSIIAGLQDQLNQVNLLASAYDGATSAYQKWLDAQAAGEQGDIYDNIRDTALKRGDELLEAGLIGTEEFRAITELMTGLDLSGSTAGQIAELYKGLSNEVAGTGHSMRDFFTEGIQGADNFVDALKKLGHAEEDEAGNIWFKDINTEEVAKELGTTVDVVEALFGKLKDYGADLHIFSPEQAEELKKNNDAIEKTKQKIDEANESAAHPMAVSIDVENLNDVESLDHEITNLQAILASKEELGLDDNQYVAFKELLDELIERKNTLTGFDTTQGVTTASLEAGAKSIENLTRKMSIWDKQGFEINVEDEGLREDAEILASLPREQKIAYGFEGDATAEDIIRKIAEDNGWTIKIDAEVDSSMDGNTEEVINSATTGAPLKTQVDIEVNPVDLSNPFEAPFRVNYPTASELGSYTPTTQQVEAPDLTPKVDSNWADGIYNEIAKITSTVIELKPFANMDGTKPLTDMVSNIRSDNTLDMNATMTEDEAVSNFRNFVEQYREDPINLGIETEEADQKVDELKQKIEEPTEPIQVSAETEQAKADVEDVKIKASEAPDPMIISVNSKSAEEGIKAFLKTIPEEKEITIKAKQEPIDNPVPTPVPTPTPTSGESSDSTPKTTSPKTIQTVETHVSGTDEISKVGDAISALQDKTITIDADASEAWAEIDAVADATEDVPEEQETNVTVNSEGLEELKDTNDNLTTFGAFGSQQSVANTITQGLSELQQSVSANQTFRSMGDHTVTNTTRNITITENRGGGTSPVNGTAHVNGTVLSNFYGSAHAGGDWRTKKGETALMAELGPEILVNGKTGQWELIGEHGAQFQHVPAGSIIFNHKQSKELLQNGFTLGRAHANGTVTFGSWDKKSRDIAHGNSGSNSGSSSGNKSNTNSNSSKSSSDSSTEKDSKSFSDWLSKLFNWAEIRLTRLNRLTEKWSNKAEKAVRYAYNNITNDAVIDKQYKNASVYYAKAIKAVSNEIVGQQKAEKTYSSMLSKIAKKGGLDSKTIKKIKNQTKNGTFDIESYESDKSSVINAYKDYYEKVLACKDAVIDLTESQADLAKSFYNLPIDQASAKIEKLSANLSALQSVASATSGGTKNYFSQLLSDATSANAEAQADKSRAMADYSSSEQTAVAAQRKVNSLTKKVKKTKDAKKKKKLQKQLASAKKARDKAVAERDSKLETSRAASLAGEYARQQLEEVYSLQNEFADQPSYVYTNRNLDRQYEIQLKINQARQEALSQAEMNRASMLAKRDVANANRDKKGKSILNTKKWKKLLSQSQIDSISSGNKVSTKGIKNKKLLAALKEYNKLVKTATSSTKDFTAAEEALSTAQNDLVTSQAETVQMLQDNAQAKFDNIGTYFENQRSLNSAEYSRLSAEMEYNNAKGLSQVGDEQLALLKAQQDQQNAIVKGFEDQIAEQEKYLAAHGNELSEDAKKAARANIISTKQQCLEARKVLFDLEDQIADFPVIQLDIDIDRVTSKLSELQDNLDIKLAGGQYASFEDYADMIGAANEEIALREKENAILQKKMVEQNLDKNSKEYIELEKQINSNNSAIRSATKSTLEWKKAIAQLPFDKLERARDVLKEIANTISSMQDVNSAYGITPNLEDYTSQQSNLADQVSNSAETMYRAYDNWQKALSGDGTYGGKSAEEWQKQYLAAQTDINTLWKQLVEINNQIGMIDINTMQSAADLIATIASYNQSMDDLKVARGYELVFEDYERQLDDLNREIQSTENLRSRYYDYYQQALSNTEKPGYQYGKSADEWLKLYYEMGTKANGLQKNWYDLYKQIADIPLNELKKLIDELDHMESQINSLLNLFDDFETFQHNSSQLTDIGVTKFNLLAQAMEKSRKQIAYYNTEIETVNEELARGLITQDEANEKLMTYNQNVMSAANSLAKYKSAIINYIKEGIDKETDAMSELIDKRKEALRRQKEADDYSRSINDKNKEINRIQMQIVAMSGDTTAATQAKIKQLQAQLADKQKDLDETRKDHSYDILVQGLEDENEAFKKAQDKRKEELGQSIEAYTEAINKGLEYTTSQYTTTATQLDTIAQEFGLRLEGYITEPWESASGAMITFVNATTALDMVESKIIEIKQMLDEYSTLHVQTDTEELQEIEDEIQRLKDLIAEKVAMGADPEEIDALQAKLHILEQSRISLNARNNPIKPTVDFTNITELIEKLKEAARLKASIGDGLDSLGDDFGEITEYYTEESDLPYKSVTRAVETEENKAIKGAQLSTPRQTSTTTTTTSWPTASASNETFGLTQAYANGDSYKVTSTSYKFRKTPDRNGDYAVSGGSIPQGTKVTTLGQVKISDGRQWVKIKYNGTTGWIQDYGLQKARTGTKAAQRGLYLTDEEGIGSEAILTKNGVLRQLDAGDMVFNANQREALWNLSKLDMSAFRKIAGNNGTTITNTYGSLLTVNGDVTRDALPELEEILKRACEYTKKDMFMTQRKKGF